MFIFISFILPYKIKKAKIYDKMKKKEKIMKKFTVNSEYQNVILFGLDCTNMTLQIEVLNNSGYWEWDYDVFSSRWYRMNLKNGILSEKKGQKIEKNEQQEIKANFYEFVRQLKNDPKYRLKLLPKLDDEMRKVWNLV